MKADYNCAGNLAGYRVLVTGGARGICAATARRFLEQGARVAIGARREASVEAFSYLASYHRNQQLLMQVLGPSHETLEPERFRPRS